MRTVEVLDQPEDLEFPIHVRAETMTREPTVRSGQAACGTSSHDRSAMGSFFARVGRGGSVTAHDDT